MTLEDDAGLSFLTLELPQCDFTGAEVTSKALVRYEGVSSKAVRR